MHRKLLYAALSLVLVFSVACKKQGVSLVDAGLRNNPTDTKGSFKWLKSVNRGQIVKIMDEDKSGNWMKVQLADGVTEGWIQKDYIHKGDKEILEITQTTKMRDQPDLDSKVTAELPVGMKVIVINKKGTWNYVSVKYGQNGWVEGGLITSGTDTKSQTKNEIYIAGIGKCNVEASATLADSSGYSYSVTNLFDKNPGTTWQAEKGGIGEWIEITFPNTVSISASIINGFAKVDPKFSEYGANGDLYELNNRVKSLKVETWNQDGQNSATANLEDGVRDYQDVGTYQNITKIRLTIDSVYKGLKWTDTALGEININKL